VSRLRVHINWPRTLVELRRLILIAVGKHRRGLKTKIKNKLACLSTQKFLSVSPHNLDTVARRRFSVAAPRFWNSLSLNCRTAPSVNIFKIRLKTFLFDSA